MKILNVNNFKNIFEKVGSLLGRKTNSEIIDIVEFSVKTNKDILMKRKLREDVDFYYDSTVNNKDENVRNKRKELNDSVLQEIEWENNTYKNNLKVINKYKKRYTKICVKNNKSLDKVNNFLDDSINFNIELDLDKCFLSTTFWGGVFANEQRKNRLNNKNCNDYFIALEKTIKREAFNDSDKYAIIKGFIISLSLNGALKENNISKSNIYSHIYFSLLS